MAISRIAEWQTLIDSIIVMIQEWGQVVQIQSRAIGSPELGGVDFKETFTNKFTIIAAFDTANKTTITFDGVTVSDDVTHILYTEYNSLIKSSDWLLYQNRRFNIEGIEDIGELAGVQRINAKERGHESEPASAA